MEDQTHDDLKFGNNYLHTSSIIYSNMFPSQRKNYVRDYFIFIFFSQKINTLSQVKISNNKPHVVKTFKEEIRCTFATSYI